MAKAAKAAKGSSPFFCFNAFYNLGIVQTKLGKIEESEKNYQQAILLNPNFLSAKYMLSRLSGDNQPSSAPKEYVEGLFNNFADHYENLMIEKLEFKVPGIIRKIILDQPPGSTIHDFHSLPYDYVSVQPGQIRSLSFRIADYRGRTVDLLHNGVSFSLFFVPEDEF